MSKQPQQVEGDGIVKTKPDRMAAARAAKAAKRAAAQQPSGVAAAPVTRNAPNPDRGATRAQARDPDRLPTRRGAVVATSRAGEILSRRMTQVGDIFHVPENEIPEGWDYQWNTVTVANQAMPEMENQMFANGWRPVPASRHPGRWTAPNYEGAIIVKGMRLEERPKSLGDEARAEDISRAKGQMRDQTDSLKLTEKLPKGYEASRKYRGTGGAIRMQIDKGLDIPLPEHEIDE